jgi:hypothetical protein
MSSAVMRGANEKKGDSYGEMFVMTWKNWYICQRWRRTHSWGRLQRKYSSSGFFARLSLRWNRREVRGIL